MPVTPPFYFSDGVAEYGVVVSIHNRADILERTLSSLLATTLSPAAVRAASSVQPQARTASEKSGVARATAPPREGTAGGGCGDARAALASALPSVAATSRFSFNLGVPPLGFFSQNQLHPEEMAFQVNRSLKTDKVPSIDSILARKTTLDLRNECKLQTN